MIFNQDDTNKLYLVLKKLIEDIEFDELEEYLSSVSNLNKARNIINEIESR